MHIFGVTIQTQSREATWQRIHQALSSDTFHRVTTLNPEFLLQAHEDTNFRDNLNQADIQTIDGGGLRLAFWRAHQPWPGRITGHQLVDTLCCAVRLSSIEVKNWKIGIIANQEGLSSFEEILQALRKKYPDLDCTGISIPQQTTSITTLSPEQFATLQTCVIIFCNLGAPNQEYLLESLRQHPGHIRLAIGVGGVFDILTGKLKQSPVWLAACGLEWLWRLLQQPKRFRRIFRAVVVFLWTCFFSSKKLR